MVPYMYVTLEKMCVNKHFSLKFVRALAHELRTSPMSGI